VVIGEDTRPAYPFNIQDPNAEEGQEELQPNQMSLEEFNNVPRNRCENSTARRDSSLSKLSRYIRRSSNLDSERKNASSLLMSVLGDDIVNDLMNELGDPVAMWNVLESTYSSKTGTNILTILNGVVTKKLGRYERMVTHIGHLEGWWGLFHQLTNIQGTNEGIDGKRKDLTITGDIFKCMLLAYF
jgi:gag-polypeptide of LTR copia-type